MLMLLLLHIWPGKLTRRTLISSFWIWANRCEIWVGCHFEMKYCSIGRYIQKMIMCQAIFRTACKWKMSSISPFWCIRQKPYYDSVDKNAQRTTVAHWSLSGAQPNAMTRCSHIIISANGKVLLMQLWKCRYRYLWRSNLRWPILPWEKESSQEELSALHDSVFRFYL